MKRLVIDIETIPHLVWSWDLFKAFITPDRIVEPSRMICFAAKYVDSPGVMYSSEYHAGHDQMVERAWYLLNDADVVIHYNGEKFDVPKLNTEFERLALGPPSPFKQVDLLKTARRRFSFPSNKLGAVGQDLDLGAKVANEGWPLWAKCIAGDADAWALMREYNKGDVELTEKLYKRLLPWIEGIPSAGAFSGESVCPACGGELARQGHAYTRTGKYQRYQCLACRKWSRATRRESGTQITEVGV